MDSNRISFTAADSLPLKICAHKGLLESLSLGKIMPIHVQLIPTNRCNYNCSFCSCGKRDKTIELPLQEIRGISGLISEYGCKAVTITGGGEPLMHPHINEIIQTLHQHNMDVGLVTNGMLLDCLEKDYLTWCRISCSNENGLTVKLENIIHNAVAKNPSIDWSFSYVISTPDEICVNKLAKIVNYANDHKFTHVRIVPNLLNIHNTLSMYSVRDMLSGIVDDRLVIYQERTRWDHGVKNCLISLLKPVINADGFVFACCGQQYAREEFDLDMPVDMRMCHWTELKDTILQQKHYDGSDCVRCYYNNYNEMLGLLTSDIQHRNFL
jgi:organic radical activating enzyme